MKRWILALIVVFGVARLASAEYLIIKVNLDKKTKTKEGEPEDEPLAATAVIGITGKPVLLQKTILAGHYQCRHKLGAKGGLLTLFADQKTIFYGVSDQTSAVNDYKIKEKDLLKDNSSEKRVALAEWALNRGLMRDFTVLMDSVAKQDTPPVALKPVVNAYRQLQAELKVKDGEEFVKKSLPDDLETVKFWKDKFGNLKGPYVTPHYAILYDAGANNPAEVKQLGTRLEHSFEAFYSWFALKAQTLPQPKKKLIVVLIDKPDDFKRYHALFDSVPLDADGFYARRENLPILSSVRQDEVYELLRKQNQAELWAQGWNQEALVEGKGIPQTKKVAIAEYTRAMMLAVLQKAMQEEGDLHTSTYVAARQLAAVSGLIPRNVTAPEWIQFGMASMFETPKGALWTGYGGPHWDYLLEFKHPEKLGLADTPEVALERVITDYYFHHHHHLKGIDAVQRHAWGEIARMTAWALTYFLAQKHNPELMRYFQELASLPRDLEFDQEVLLGCFARAMNIADPTKPRGFNVEKMNVLAKEWQQFIFNTAPPIPEPKLQEIHKVMKVIREIKNLEPPRKGS